MVINKTIRIAFEKNKFETIHFKYNKTLFRVLILRRATRDCSLIFFSRRALF